MLPENGVGTLVHFCADTLRDRFPWCHGSLRRPAHLQNASIHQQERFVELLFPAWNTPTGCQPSQLPGPLDPNRILKCPTQDRAVMSIWLDLQNAYCAFVSQSLGPHARKEMPQQICATVRYPTGPTCCFGPSGWWFCSWWQVVRVLYLYTFYFIILLYVICH